MTQVETFLEETEFLADGLAFVDRPEIRRCMARCQEVFSNTLAATTQPAEMKSVEYAKRIAYETVLNEFAPQGSGIRCLFRDGIGQASVEKAVRIALAGVA